MAPMKSPSASIAVFVLLILGIIPEPASSACVDGYYPLGYCVPNYEACAGGAMYPLTCPTGTVFDATVNQCVSSSKCITTPAPTTRKPLDCVGALDGNYPFPNSCSSSYYACLGGNFYPQTCPGGGIFDPVKKQCVSSSVASCSATSGTGTTLPATTPIGETTGTTQPPPTTLTDATTASPTTEPSTTTATTPTTSLTTESTTAATTPTTPTTTSPESTTPTTPSATTPTTATASTAPTTIPPYTCIGNTPDKFEQIAGYCGPNIYYCPAAGAPGIPQTCPDPPYNYFDTGSRECKPCFLAQCTTDPSACPVPPTTAPVNCPPGSTALSLPFYKIKYYCGPDYYYCAKDDEPPSRQSCAIGYFDCMTRGCGPAEVDTCSTSCPTGTEL